MKYGVGEAVRKSNGGYVYPKFPKTYTSIVKARKEAYKMALENNDCYYVYEIRESRKLQLGYAQRTYIQPNKTVDFTKFKVIWQTMNQKGNHIYYLNKDGTLGVKRY